MEEDQQEDYRFSWLGNGAWDLARRTTEWMKRRPTRRFVLHFRVGEWCKGGCQGNAGGSLLARVMVEVRLVDTIRKGRIHSDILIYTDITAFKQWDTLPSNNGICNSLRLKSKG
ncbi:unnamed protein product [Linum trigynum]|uniref:Uncharacterized protein n=1 Tax=Linum trigynum TaxID=586398 RepID=A0AAV2D7Y0_9ROSI